MDEKTPDEDKITKLAGEIRVQFLFNLANFCNKLEQGEIQLSDFYDSYLIQLDKCIQIGEEQNKKLIYNEEKQRQITSVLISCREKNKREMEKRSSNN